MFDPSLIELGGVSLIILVFGLVEFIKNTFDLSGAKVTILSALLGVIIYVIYALIGVLPQPYEQWATIVVQSLAFGLAASGYYKYLKNK